MSEIAIDSYSTNSKVIDSGFSSVDVGGTYPSDMAQNGAPNEGLITGITIVVCVILGVVLGIIVAKKKVK